MSHNIGRNQTSRRGCSGCGDILHHIFHKCLDCDDYELCPTCVALRTWGSNHLGHSEAHTFIQLTEVTDVQVIRTDDQTRISRERLRALQESVHHDVDCNRCRRPIKGIRLKCIQCGNLDLCHNCIYYQAEVDELSHTFVMFVEKNKLIYKPIVPHPSIEEPSIDSPSTNNPSNPPTTQSAVTDWNREGVCDGCGRFLRATQFICLVCTNYRMCTPCFGRVSQTHPGHSFIRCNNINDIIVESPSRPPPIHPNNCSHCHQRVVGSMYRCIHPACESIALCERCESLPPELGVHPLSHPLVKFRHDYTPDRRRQEIWDEILRFSRSLHPRMEDIDRGELSLSPLPGLHVYMENVCPICYADMTGRRTIGAPCGHILCTDCRENVVKYAREDGRSACCHVCRLEYDST